MKRRIRQKRKLALDRLATAYRATWGGGGTNAGHAHAIKTGAVRRYARNWLLSTGELPTGIHEVPWPTDSGWTNWESTEVDFDRLAALKTLAEADGDEAAE